MTTLTLECVERLQALLAENPATATAKLCALFDQTVGDGDRPIVLFGAGPVGRRTLAGLRMLGREPLAFADNNPGLWGRVVDGLRVLPPAEAVAVCGEDGVCVVTIFNHSAVRRQLQGMNCRRVVAFPSLYWKYPGTFLPYCNLDRLDPLFIDPEAVLDGLGLWDDDCSRQYYLSQLHWRFDLDTEKLPRPCAAADTYFPRDVIRPLADEVFVDCGAYQGDTLAAYLAHCRGRFKRVVALEPDPHNFAGLRRYVESLLPEQRERIRLEPIAAASHNGSLSFAASGDVCSSVTATGTTSLDCGRLDDLLADDPPTYIKMDIEGGELDALAGARQTIARHRPVLAICAYHRATDLWQIPHAIKSLCPDYRLFLRLYAEDCWESVCYAVPRSRCVQET